MASKSPIEAQKLWFEQMIDHCYDYAMSAKQQGKPIVGIACEFAPRELILAAGGVPVCLCGGHASTIPAAETELPASLCPLIKSTYGFHVEKANPFLEMADLIVAETTCDGKKKMFEKLAESRPVTLLELPQKPDDPEAFRHWRSELDSLRLKMQEQFKRVITDDDLRGAIRLMNRERTARRQLAEHLMTETPAMSGGELLEMKSSISCIPEDLEQYDAALSALRHAEGRPELANRVRVLITGVPIVHGAEKVMNLLESLGGLVVASENCTGLKPIIENIDETDPDPMNAIARKYFALHCSVMTPNNRRIDHLRQIGRDFRPDCVVDLIWQGCTPYEVESRRIQRFVDEELKLPFLRIVTDYSPSDTASLSVRIQALFEMARTRKSPS